MDDFRHYENVERDPLYCCEWCGKNFYTLNPTAWTYRKKTPASRILYFCGWNCMRAWEKDRDARRPTKTRRGSEYYEVYHFKQRKSGDT